MYIAGDALGSGELLAHPVAVLAIPALVPAVVVVGVIVYIAKKDRREEQQERELANAEPSTTKVSG
ncbi:MAG TPA: hypothetical protein VJ777_20865 [Mycobacterium sp.]|nr:hypothetical protein [Mycobacterium sp.]